MRTGEDAVYLVRTDFTDSTKISNKPYKGYMGVLSMALSSNQTHVMFGGNLVQLNDDKLIMLDTVSAIISLIDRPNVGCGIVKPSFNPVYDEVTFTIACDDGHTYEILRMGVYDYLKNKIDILNPLSDNSNYFHSTYFPNGLDIAFISEGRLYFLKREIVQ
jgi:hypothetical protein